VTYWVRIVFRWHGELMHEFLGPFDRYFAELVCTDFADAPYRYGLDYVRVERARIVAAEEAAA
jgi:hypothetical protein